MWFSLAHSHSKTSWLSNWLLIFSFTPNMFINIIKKKTKCALTGLRCKCASAANKFLYGVFIASQGEDQRSWGFVTWPASYMTQLNNSGPELRRGGGIEVGCRRVVALVLNTSVGNSNMSLVFPGWDKTSFQFSSCRISISSLHIQGNIILKGAICNMFTVINHKITMMCQQRLSKHAKLKYWLLWQPH